MKRCWKNRSKSLFTAVCIAAAIATSWGWVECAKAVSVVPQIIDYQISGSINPTADLSDVYVLYTFTGSNNSQSVGLLAFPSGDTFAANQTTSYGFDFQTSASNFNNYMLVGVYNATTSNPGLTIGVNQGEWTALINNGVDFSQLSGLYLNGLSENVLIDALENKPGTSLYNYISYVSPNLLNSSGVSFGNQVYLVNFSNAIDGGSATVYTPSAVSIPSPAYLLGPGLGLLLLLRRISVS